MKKGFRNALVIMLVALMAFSFVSCGKKAESEAQPAVEQKAEQPAATPDKSPAKKAVNKTITLAMVQPWDTLIPFETTSSYSDVINDLIYDKLVYLKADGTYEPRLAESVELSEDGTEMTFHLRKDAKWSDGHPVTAKDVIFTAQILNSPSVEALRKAQMNMVKGYGEGEDSLEIYAPDDYTVTFVLTEPTNPDYLLFTKFRDVYIIPEHILGSVPRSEIRNADYWKNPVSSGPCVYQSQISGERIEFTPNPYYYNMNGNWEKFVVRVVPNGNLLAGLMNGEIDALAGNVASLQINDWDMAQKQPNLRCESVPSVAYQYMAINHEKPYMTNRVAQAINMAIDRNLMVTGLLKGMGQPAWGPIPPTNIYYNPEIEEEFNPEKAHQILVEEGWDFDRVLTMSVPTGNTLREQSALIIQQNLAAIGMKTEIISSDFPTHLNRVRAGECDFGFIGSSGSPDPSECVINFSPAHMNNFGHLTDWTVHNAGQKGAHVFTVEDRKVAYDEYQRLIREQVPFAFTYMENILYANNNRIEGIKDMGDYTQMNRDVWNWKIVE